MKAKIKKEWVEYDYAINANHTAIESILLGLQNNGITAEYIGKSKAILIKGKIVLLKKRSLFFKYI